MDNNPLDRIIDQSLHIPLPKGLEQRLEKRIDALAAREKRRTGRRLLYLTGGVAAALAAGIFLALQPAECGEYSSPIAVTDPAEAATVTREALRLLSTELNRGFDQVASARREIEQANRIFEQLTK
jgi:hypothetical protein